MGVEKGGGKKEEVEEKRCERFFQGGNVGA